MRHRDNDWQIGVASGIGTFLLLLLLFAAGVILSGCGTCHVVERYNESYATGWLERCPEGVWVYNYDKITGEHKRYFLTNDEMDLGERINFIHRSNLSVLQLRTNL